jgi:hypothetical protein
MHKSMKWDNKKDLIEFLLDLKQFHFLEKGD